MKHLKISFSFAVTFLLLTGLLHVYAKSEKLKKNSETDWEQAEYLDMVAYDTWQYFDWATTNHLPWSWRSTTVTTAGDYANTAEIGLYALTWLAAYDLQRPWSPDWPSTETEIMAVLNQLRAWQTGSQSQQPHGPNAYMNSVFYQWYWISWNPPVVSNREIDHLVPSVDNAWLAASLITIRAYALTHNQLAMAQQADAILSDMNFRLWYHPETNFFTWGGVEDPQGGTPADYYSNENRIINFVARALGHLTRDEYKMSLEAMTQIGGVYNSLVVEKMAYDGSYFTYTTPAIFVREVETVYGTNTILPATQAQIAYSQDQNYTAWGFSDCFDVGMGDYIQQGAPPAAISQPETRPGLVTPHASALALITPLSTEAISNLQTLSNTYDCVYENGYGFYDSVMTAPYSSDYGQCSHRFSSLAQAWIFLAIVNYETGFVWDYFYRDQGVRAAHAEMFDELALYLPIITR